MLNEQNTDTYTNLEPLNPRLQISITFDVHGAERIIRQQSVYAGPPRHFGE